MAENYVGNVLAGFQAGRQMMQQDATRNALGALLRNPGDQQALQRLGSADPQAAMQFQSQQLEAHKLQLEDANKKLGVTLQLLGTAHDEGSYQQARQTAAQMGLDVSRVPPTFNPQWVANTAAQAQAMQGKLQQQTADIQNYEYALGHGFKGDFPSYMQIAHPPSPLTIPYGATVTQPGQQQMPHVSSPQEASQLAPGTQFIMPDGRIGTVPGGAGSNASGGFPSGSQ